MTLLLRFLLRKTQILPCKNRAHPPEGLWGCRMRNKIPHAICPFFSIYFMYLSGFSVSF